MLACSFITHGRQNEKNRMNAVTFYVSAMIFEVFVLMKFFPTLFQSELIAFIPLFFPAFTPVDLNIFSSRRLGTSAAMFPSNRRDFHLFLIPAGTNMLTTVLVTYLFSG